MVILKGYPFPALLLGALSVRGQELFSSLLQSQREEKRWKRAALPHA